MGTPVRAHDGRIVGDIRGDTLVLKRRKSRHWLRLANGWAIDEVVLRRAKEAGVETVVVLDQESGVAYRAALSKLLACGTPVDLGHGRQYALPEREWATERPAQSQLRLL